MSVFSVDELLQEAGVGADGRVHCEQFAKAATRCHTKHWHHNWHHRCCRKHRHCARASPRSQSVDKVRRLEAGPSFTAGANMHVTNKRLDWWEGIFAAGRAAFLFLVQEKQNKGTIWCTTHSTNKTFCSEHTASFDYCRYTSSFTLTLHELADKCLIVETITIIISGRCVWTNWHQSEESPSVFLLLHRNGAGTGMGW